MGSEQRYKVSAGYRKCDICGESMPARGIGTHRRQVHGLVVKTVVRTKVNDLSTKVINSSDHLTTKVADLSNNTIQSELESVTGKDLSECKRPDGKHFYTDQDLRILTAKLIIQTYHPGSEVALFNQFGFMDLIADFERRFECRFDDVRKANSHGKISIEMGTTMPEHHVFAEKYGSLKYSR